MRKTKTTGARTKARDEDEGRGLGRNLGRDRVTARFDADVVRRFDALAERLPRAAGVKGYTRAEVFQVAALEGLAVLELRHAAADAVGSDDVE